MNGSSPTSLDSHWMMQALTQAEEGVRRTSPNPRVGCVLVNPAGEAIGVGSTQKAGGPHAEVVALRDAAARGLATAGACAYVTLEPCSHQGRTGPCCDALLNAGISRVVASLADPNPLVAGRGFERLRQGGVQVSVGLGAEASRELNIGFFSRMVRGTPWVRVKAAASLDGRTALPNGQSQWITSAAARADGHAWRARACAILTGIGTVLADNPRLDVREVETPRQPTLVIVDSALQLAPDAALFDATRPVLVYTAKADGKRAAALEARGAAVIEMAGSGGRVNLPDLLADLGRREINELHVEAGAQLNGALMAENAVDEFLVYLAPRLMGSGSGIAEMPLISRMSDSNMLEFFDVETVGPDLRLRVRPQGRTHF